MKKFVPYIITLAIIFYILPFILSITPIIKGILEMATLIITMFILTIVALIYGCKHGFSFMFLLLALALFLPYGLVFYSPARIIFSLIIYGITILIGNSLGLMFRKK